MFNQNRVLGRPPHLKKNEWKIGVEEKFLTFAGVLVLCRWIWRREGVGRAALTGENDDMHRQRAAIIKKTFKKRQSIFLLRWEMLILQTVRTRKNLWIYLL